MSLLPAADSGCDWRLWAAAVAGVAGATAEKTWNLSLCPTEEEEGRREGEKFENLCCVGGEAGLAAAGWDWATWT